MSARIFHFSVLRATFARCVRGGFQSGPKEDYLRAAEGRARFEILIRDELLSRRLSFSRFSRYLVRGYEPRSIWETTRKRKALQNLKSLPAAVPGRTTTVAQIRNEGKNRNEEKN